MLIRRIATIYPQFWRSLEYEHHILSTPQPLCGQSEIIDLREKLSATRFSERFPASGADVSYLAKDLHNGD